MHELSIAECIVRIAEAHARGRRVTRVHITVGHLRQVVPSALTFSFGIVAEGTVVEGAVLEIDEDPATAHCGRCGAESRLTEFPAACRACGSLDVELVGGDALRVESLELEEHETETALAPSSARGGTDGW